MKNKVAVVLLNWNGQEDSLACIDAMSRQTQEHTLIAVDNGSDDNFVSSVKSSFPEIQLFENQKNEGFAGGVNVGIRYAMESGYEYVALINNDAKPEPNWLGALVAEAVDHPEAGIITGKLLTTDGLIDSTGDQYTTWGLAYPRGRDKKDNKQYNKKEAVFGATGGASLYRTSLFEDVGLFDENFFAYYEDVDLSFRAQLAGWKVLYTPAAVAHHKRGATSAKVPGLVIYMTVKNLPWLLWKNVPLRLLPIILPRFTIAHSAIIFSSLSKGEFMPVIKGVVVSLLILPKKLVERHKIQSSRKVSVDYIKSAITYDLPTNAHNLRQVRLFFRKLSPWR